MEKATRKRGYPKTTYGVNPSAQDQFIVSGTSDRETARVTVAVASDPTINGMLRNRLTLEQQDNESYWIATVDYGVRDIPSAEFAQVSFDFKTSRQHTSHSLAVINSYAIDGRIPSDTGNGIGVSDRGVAGVDILIPELSMTISTHIEEDLIDQRYRNQLFWQTGTVNSDMFYGFAPGEVMFAGATAERSSVDQDTQALLVRLVFKFDLQPNETAANGRAIRIANLPPIDKQGWDYLDIRTEAKEDTEAKLKVYEPFEAHVHRIYRRTSFAALGLNGVL